MTDIIVLGAGMVGVSTALELQSRGHSVKIVERSEPGAETSYGNAGVIMADTAEPFAMPRNPIMLLKHGLGLSNDLTWSWAAFLKIAPALASYYHHSEPKRHARISHLNAQLALRATRDHTPFIEASGADNLISRDGFVELFRSEKAFERTARDLGRIRSEYGVSARVIGGEEYASEEPAILKAPKGAIHWPQSWSCADPGGLTKAYAGLFGRQGGQIAKGDAGSLAEHRSGWSVATQAGRISAEHVVIALGPWSARFLTPFGYRIKMILKRGYHAHFSAPLRPRRPFLDTDHGILVASMNRGLRLSTGVALVSENAAPDTIQLDRGIDGLRDLIVLGERLDEPLWYGVRPCMPDMLPMVGAAPRHKNMWFNFGHGHQGFTLGPTTARLLADAMDGVRNPLLDGLSPGNRHV